MRSDRAAIASSLLLTLRTRDARRPSNAISAGNLLLPGFIDSQVNGGGGVLFNDAPSVDVIRDIGRAHRKFGTTGFLPTLISADLDVVAKAIEAVQNALTLGVSGSAGHSHRRSVPQCRAQGNP